MTTAQRKYVVCSKRGCKGWAWCSANARHCIQCGSRFKQRSESVSHADRTAGGGGGALDIRPNVHEPPPKPGRWRHSSRGPEPPPGLGRGGGRK
eukprot:6070956-Pyramimonas_sp.AAC.1